MRSGVVSSCLRGMAEKPSSFLKSIQVSLKLVSTIVASDSIMVMDNHHHAAKYDRELLVGGVGIRKMVSHHWVFGL
jgi:hypothetical protein